MDTANTVQRLHGKRRGRPRNEEVETIHRLFPEDRSRRAQWNRVYYVRALGWLCKAGLANGDAIMAGAGDPLPPTVMHALGSLFRPSALFDRVARECIDLHADRVPVRDIVAYVRREFNRALLALVADEREPA